MSKVGRAVKPRCEGASGCGHPISFHGSGESECRALGCSCKRYRGQSNIAISTITVAEAAEQMMEALGTEGGDLRVWRNWIMENLVLFNGREVDNADLRFGGRKRTGSTFRVDIDKVDRYIAKRVRQEARRRERAAV